MTEILGQHSRLAIQVKALVGIEIAKAWMLAWNLPTSNAGCYDLEIGCQVNSMLFYASRERYAYSCLNIRSAS
jgi:hypothetical protein